MIVVGLLGSVADLVWAKGDGLTDCNFGIDHENWWDAESGEKWGVKLGQRECGTCREIIACSLFLAQGSVVRERGVGQSSQVLQVEN